MRSQCNNILRKEISIEFRKHIYIRERREKILRLYSIDFIASKWYFHILAKKIVFSIYRGFRLKKDLRNNIRFYRKKKYTKTTIMFEANIRSLLSVSAHVESSLPSRTFILVSILINFSCLLADLRSGDLARITSLRNGKTMNRVIRFCDNRMNDGFARLEI